MKVWVDGRLVDPGEANVSVFDHGFTVGDGVFETLRTYGGRPFAVRRHLERLAASAASIGIGVPDAGVLREALDAVVAASGAEEMALRITATSGAGPLGSSRGGGPPTVVVSAAPLPAWPETTDVVVVPWARNEHGAMVGVKTTSYAENVVALHWAQERGAGEALFVNLAGNVCEGTGSNVFAAVGGRLVTPPLSAGCLAGVTRALVVEACGVAEADLTPGELEDAGEAFLTSSTRDVQAIRAVGPAVLRAAPGPLTREAAAALAAVVRAGIDP